MQMRGIADEINPVTRAHGFLTIARHDQLAITDNDKNRHRQIGKQIGEMPDRGVDDRAFTIAQNADKIHLAATQRLDIKRTRHTKLVADSSRYFCFGRDDVIDWQLVR